MKKLLSIIILGLFFMVLGCEKDSLFELSDQNNDTKVTVREFPAHVEEMIDGGINWLLEQRNDDGSFSGGQEIVARTAMAVVKLCDRSIELGNAQPLDGPYATEILAGLEYIESKEIDYGFGKAYTEVGNTHHENYNTAWALMAFVATRDFGLYGSQAQGAADYFSSSQADNGGWGYNAAENDGWQDNSNTGYVALALVAAQNFGCNIGGVVGPHETWVDLIQDNASGGSIYSPQYGNPWINMLKTGNLLFEMAFVGDKANDTRVMNAVGYLETHWNDNNSDPGFRPHNYQAMYTMMKGFEALGIDAINGGSIDWYAEFVEIIDATKLTGPTPGTYYWPNAEWTDEYLSSVFTLLTLEKVVELPNAIVDFDIKPTSCPNPFNMKAKGWLPVAILGTADFDVTQVDLTTVVLEGVAPVNHDFEDVTTPVVDPADECDCTTEGPDGYTDLTLKFERQDLVAMAPALQGVTDGQVVVMTISGTLIDGQPFEGKDCVVILKKGKA